MTENSKPKRRSPRPHVVTINYTGGSLGPDKNPLKVVPNDTITFKQGKTPPGHSMRISFDQPQHFSAPVFREGDDPIKVLTVSGADMGKYKCELVADKSGSIQPGSVPGGSLEVDTGQQDNR